MAITEKEHSNSIQSVQEQLKETELGLLEAFIHICEELELPYFAVQGTLIGTIRHNGFIPWDDDIDVGMIRQDYEIFLEKAQELLPEYYFLQTIYTDPEHYHCFAKLRDSRTTFIENTTQHLKRMNQGIYIDIFPFDFYPDNKLQARWFDLRKFLFRYRVRSMFYIPQDYERGLGNALRRILMWAARQLIPSEREALMKSEQMYKSVKPGQLLINNGSPWGRREIVKRVWMEKTEYHVFERLSIRIPISAKAYLQKVYGDYLQLPPVEERKTHHFTRVIDPTTPYTYWMTVLSEEGQ